MSGTAKISGAQLACAVGIFGEVAALLYLPAGMAKEAGPGAWLCVPVGQLVSAVPICVMLGMLCRLRPGRSLSEIAEFCLGRWGAVPIQLIQATFAVVLGALVTRNVIDLSIVAILPGTPMWVIGALFAAVAAYLCYSGGEVIARYAVLVLGITIPALIFMTGGLVEDSHLLWLRPVLGDGLAPIWRGAIPALHWFGEVWLFGEFLGLLDRPGLAIRFLLIGQAIAGAILVVMIVLCLLVFSPPLLSKLWFPAFLLAQQVSLTGVMERLEMGLVAAWLTGMVLKVAVCLWVASVSLTRVVRVTTDRKLVPPVAAATLALSLFTRGAPSLMWANNTLFTPLLLPIQLGIPALLLAICWWKSRGRNRGAAA